MKNLHILALLVLLFSACKNDNTPDYYLLSEKILAVKDYTPAQRSLILDWCRTHHMVIYDVDRSMANPKASIEIITDIQEPLEFGGNIELLKQKLISDNPKCEINWRGENNIYMLTLMNK